MKEQIEITLSVLIGQPLVSAVRAANMQMFGFGKWVNATHGEDRKVGEYALHLQCAWRIVKSNRILVAQRDMYYASGDCNEEPEGWEWDKAGANRCDERTKQLIAEHVDGPLVVESVEADYVGSLRLVFSKGVMLEVFPDDSLGEEHWRFFKSATEDKHFVVYDEGIESK